MLGTFLDYCILAFSDKSMTAIASVMMHYGFVTDKKTLSRKVKHSSKSQLICTDVHISQHNLLNI